MSQEVQSNELRKETQHLLDGPLKHVRSAALAAALVPLASLVATPASAQTTCQSAGTVCGLVFDDANKNGLQDSGEAGLEGVKVSIYDSTNTLVASTDTGPDGTYSFLVQDGTYTIEAKIPAGMTTSPTGAGSDDTIDSDGTSNGAGSSIATGVVVVFDNPNTDFGFFPQDAFPNPGTGTPGYWKNHQDAWPDAGVIVGGIPYTVDQAISWLKKVGKDKTTTMFSSLVPAMLNVLNGNDPTCIQSAITAGNAWMATYGPVGSNVPASSAAWATSGEAIHKQLDAYNNGQLCAPHRQ